LCNGLQCSAIIADRLQFPSVLLLHLDSYCIQRSRYCCLQFTQTTACLFYLYTMIEMWMVSIRQ